MSGMKPKLTRHAKKQKITIQNKVENQSMETDPATTDGRMMKQAEKDIKTAYLLKSQPDQV